MILVTQRIEIVEIEALPDARCVSVDDKFTYQCDEDTRVEYHCNSTSE